MKRRGRPPYADVLTPREWEVLGLLRDGLSNEQIAERLGITQRTAKFHVSEILSKLGVDTREQTAAWRPEAPAPMHRWLAWPLAARVAGALVVVVAVAGLGLLAWGVLQTSGGNSEAASEALLRRAVQLLDEAESYRAEMDVDGDGTADYVEEIVPPDSYHLWMRTDYAPADASNPWREYIYYTSGSYTRACDDFPDCDGWIQIRGLGPIDKEISGVETPKIHRGWSSVALELGSAFFSPGFGLEAMRIAYDPRLEGGASDAQLTATTEVYEAALSSLVAAFDSLGQYEFSEYYERESRRWDTQHVQGDVYVWLSSSGTPDRLQLSFDNPYVYQTPLPTPGRYVVAIQSAPPVGQTLDIRFSRFNEVTITLPADFIPLSTPKPTP